MKNDEKLLRILKRIIDRPSIDRTQSTAFYDVTISRDSFLTGEDLIQCFDPVTDFHKTLGRDRKKGSVRKMTKIKLQKDRKSVFCKLESERERK